MSKLIKSICCIGAGYVGGPTMAVIAHKCKHLRVNVVDIDSDRIEAWNSKDLNKLPVFEPGLDKIVKECRGINLFFSTDINSEITNADMIFLSVNTPVKSKGIGAGQASDLKFIESSARQIAKYAKGETIVVEKSTIPVKTAELIKKILKEAENDNIGSKESKSFTVLSNPEFLAEGSAINDLINPDRILIGGEDNNSIKILENIYKFWVEPKKIIKTNLWSSELSKLVANAFLAQRISSINSISALCETTGADISEVSKAVGMDNRIGEKFLKVGPGFGGSCFKKDISNLIYLCQYYNLMDVAKYWEQILIINDWQQKRISKIIVEKLFGTISGKKICILGFAFKANTNDTRESPAISVCNDLLEEGAILNIYDPKVTKDQIKNNLNKDGLKDESINSLPSIKEAVKDSDAIVIMTEWEEFKKINWTEIYPLMRKPAWIFDTRRILEIKNIHLKKFHFWSIGK